MERHRGFTATLRQPFDSNPTRAAEKRNVKPEAREIQTRVRRTRRSHIIQYFVPRGVVEERSCPSSPFFFLHIANQPGTN